MITFDRSYEKMTSKQRVVNTFNFQPVDRTPINYMTNPTIHMNFSKALGIEDGNYEKVLDILGVDFAGMWAGYKGPLLFPQIEGCNVDPVYGFYTRLVKNEAGYYYDFCNFPLQFADDDFIANFPVPNPDDFDYSNVTAALEYHENRGKAVHIGGAGTSDIINSTGRVMGMEETLVRLYNDDEATLTYLDRRLAMELAVIERIMEKAKGRIDFMWLGEDLGTQIAPMISLELYRRVFRPRHQRFIDAAKSYGLPVMVHTCGSSSWVYEDFIEMGVNAVDTLQPEAANMSPEYLRDHFAGRLAFHGCISTTGVLTTGTPADVRADCIKVLDTMVPTKGYMFSPTHQIQDNTPPENVIEMYRTVHDYFRNR